METFRVTILVSGRVQGVGFRYFAVGAVRRLGLCGTVRNLPDGGVEVVAEGPRLRLDALISEVRQGPSAARVTGVTTHFAGPAGMSAGVEITGFEITG